MKLSRKWIVLAAVLVVVSLGVGFLALSRPRDRFYLAEVERGDIVSVVNATGTVRPNETVPMQATVAGRVVKVLVDQNADVKKGQILAEIDFIPNSDTVKVMATADGIVTQRSAVVGTMVREGDVLFTVARDLKQKINIDASVDQADIGLVSKANLEKQPIQFTLDTYPDDLFEGTIQEVRISPAVSQGVVTYPVVISAANPKLKLLPGMTAKLSFQIDKKTDVVKIPSAALRFFPKSRLVHPDDRAILEGTADDVAQPASTDQTTDTRSAAQRAADRQKETRRHVWIVEGEFLRAVPVKTGLNDNTFTEMVEGNLQPGQRLVTGTR